MKPNSIVQNLPPEGGAEVVHSRWTNPGGHLLGFDDIINSWSKIGLLA